jgi:predicted ATPase/DNA-binding CsgD family transcriptional regulator
MATTRRELAGRVPSARSSLIGRDEVVERLSAELARHRLVTVTGPGGAGKTRVAMAAAEACADRLADGARFVALAGLSDPVALPEVVAGTLGVARGADRPSAQALAAGIGERELLLVLDNFEQLLDAAPVVADLLVACPGLRILVTSRRRLGLPAEHVVTLEPLAVPDDPVDGRRDVAEVARVASVQLFVERAVAIDPSFELTEDNVDDVAAVCRELGGSPLAIELAAARIAVLSVRQIAARLAADPLTVLGRGPRDLPDRQRSLRATIDWSVDLLDDDERTVLRRLSVFEHSFTLDAAEQVAGLGSVTLDAVAGLVESHLVDLLDGTDTPRFAMPVPVRDVARELLDDAGEHDEVLARLVEVEIAFVEAAGKGLESPEEDRWLDEVDAELDQLRAVLAHLSAADPCARVRTAAALGPFWLHRGFLGEGRRHLGPALDPATAGSLPPELVAEAAAWEARLAADQGVVGDHEGAAAMLAQLDDGLAAARATGDVHAELRCIDFLSHVLVLHGDVDRAVSITDEGVALARAHERPWFLAQLLQRAAVFARLRGDLDAAADFAVEAWTLARLLRADRLVLHAGLTVAQLPPDDRIADPPELPWLLELADAVGDQRMRCVILLSVGIEAMLAGGIPEAAARFADAVVVAHDSGYWHGTGFSLLCSAALASVTGDHSNCAVLHGAAGPTLPVLRRGMPPAYWDLYEQLVGASRAALGEDRFESLCRDGAALGWDRAATGAVAFLDQLVASADAEREDGEARTVGTAGADGAAGSKDAAAEDADLPEPEPAPPWASLTPRELEVLERIAAGDTNKDIARRFDISPKTVMHHTMSIYRKLDVRGRAEAAAIGLRRGIIAAPRRDAVDGSA